jgi:hypothetical protein
MGDPKNPKTMCFNTKMVYIILDDLGVPPCSETSFLAEFHHVSFENS